MSIYCDFLRKTQFYNQKQGFKFAIIYDKAITK